MCFRFAYSRCFAFGLAGTCALWLAATGSVALADDAKPAEKPEANSADSASAEGASSSAGAKSTTTATATATTKSKYRPYDEVIKDADTKSGLVKLHRKGGTLYGEISPSQLNRDFIVVISIAKGIGRGQLLGGMSWGFGDDWVWQFRKVDDYIHVVRRNVRFSAAKGSPEERAVKLAYTDSVLFSLPIVSVGSGGIVVDLNPIFMSDLPQISQALPGFAFSPQRSTYADVKALPDNIEIEVAATYASGGNADIDSVPDSRGATINVHYSISYLPQNGYHPRLADDRVGYFLTVVKDYSQKTDEDRFVRYINRWDLQKADSSAEVSPPKKPIVFWLEKTIPYKYRAPIREGILEWNKAFEKAGFVNAIEVRQQPDSADWDPEDINYNTFRWITASAKFAMGPSRVNPTNGQILDADIIFDADFIQIWDNEFERFTPASIAALTGGPLDLKSYEAQQRRRHQHENGYCPDCQLAAGRALDFAFGTAALLSSADQPLSDAQREKMIMQGMKEVTMHELGHTLGLRHNFKASTYLTLDEIAEGEKTKGVGFTASVMDYTPAFIAPKGKKQGDYFSTTIGPYDMWAIEYGYRPLSGGSPQGERKELDKIAARSGEAALQFTTDEDTRGIDSDPDSNRFDLGKDAIEYAKLRAELIGGLWSTITERLVKDGDGYQRARQAFGVFLAQYGRAMHFASRYIGGVETNRSHKGDKEGRPPFRVVDAKKQRAALELLEQQVFSDKPFNFPPKLYNDLAASRWDHWGSEVPLRRDYPVHDVIAMWQGRILDQLMSPLTLDRLHDSELKIAADEDAFTTAELIGRLTKAVFSEVDARDGGEFTNRKPAISSLRRNLQRVYFTKLAELAMGNTGAPDDCATVAYAELKSLQERINKLLASDVKLDDYSKAHLTETAARIGKVLDSHLEIQISSTSFGDYSGRSGADQ
ncbi:MAG: zinc-dependent metalloprotease [Pirellulales bacterium]|nr:zinc-dependent metalloprotease [Pirellulales bacterium]